MALPLPPLAVLAQQVVLILLMTATSHNVAHCASPLLTHPLTRARLPGAWKALAVLPDLGLLRAEPGQPHQHQRDLLAGGQRSVAEGWVGSHGGRVCLDR